MGINVLSRRDFIKLVGVGTGGLVLTIYLDGCAPQPGEPAPVISALTSSPVETVTGTSTATPTEFSAASFTWQPGIFIEVDTMVY